MSTKSPPQLPETGFVRLKILLGDPNANPPIPGIIPLGRTTFLNKVKDGTFPAPVRLSKRCVAWRVEDILDLIKKIGNE